MTLPDEQKIRNGERLKTVIVYHLDDAYRIPWICPETGLDAANIVKWYVRLGYKAAYSLDNTELYMAHPEWTKPRVAA